MSTSGVIAPVASSLYVVDGTIGIVGGKTDLVGIFNRINAGAYPHDASFTVYARLVQGLGQVPFYLDVVNAGTQQLIHTSTTNLLHFPHRNFTAEMAVTFERIRFPQSAIYLIQLWCDSQWIADARLELL